MCFKILYSLHAKAPLFLTRLIHMRNLQQDPSQRSELIHRECYNPQDVNKDNCLEDLYNPDSLPHLLVVTCVWIMALNPHESS